MKFTAAAFMALVGAAVAVSNSTATEEGDRDHRISTKSCTTSTSHSRVWHSTPCTTTSVWTSTPCTTSSKWHSTPCSTSTKKWTTWTTTPCTTTTVPPAPAPPSTTPCTTTVASPPPPPIRNTTQPFNTSSPASTPGPSPAPPATSPAAAPIVPLPSIVPTQVPVAGAGTLFVLKGGFVAVLGAMAYML